MEKFLTTVFILIVVSLAIAVFVSKSDSESSADESVLESSMEKVAAGRAMKMTVEEMDAFREKNLRDSQNHKESIRSGLTREERAVQDYEDEMIMRGETRSNPQYEALQRRAEDSRR